MAHSACLDDTLITCDSAVCCFDNSESSIRAAVDSISVDGLSEVVIAPPITTSLAGVGNNNNTCLTELYPVEDISSTAVRHCKDTLEGHQGDEGPECTSKHSCSVDLLQCGSADLNLACSSKKKTKMERVSDHSPYSSDEWEDSESGGDHSDTDDDHSDSSDDDDPKSQVDRLIERGTLMFMDDENSALSSESESDSDYDDDDSESDITDVSPLISATASPVGLSPVLPRRTLSTSPLALHPRPLDHHTTEDLAVVHDNHHKQWNGLHDNNVDHTTDSTNMALLVQAVMELEKKVTKKRPKHRQYIGLPHSNIGDNNSSSVQGIHPIHDSPHHRHLIRKSSSSSRRKNMSFTNEEVRRIDRDNKILLKKNNGSS